VRILNLSPETFYNNIDAIIQVNTPDLAGTTYFAPSGIGEPGLMKDAAGKITENEI